MRKPSCPVWATNWEGNGNLVCKQGRGRDCSGMRSGSRVNVQESQRIQHGSVRVLHSLKGTEIRNLRQDFDAKYYKKRSDATEACKFMCYSDIQCGYWVYSMTDGCFVEDPPMHAVPYPLTSKDVNKNSQFAKTVIDGQYILHRCPENDGTFTSGDEGAKFTLLPWQWNWFAFHWPWDEGGWPWWGWILFFVIACCACGCCVVFCTILFLGRMATKNASKRTAPADGSDRLSGSESDSSDSESERRPRKGKSAKQALLQDQKFNSLAQGHGHTQVVSSNQGSVQGARP